MRPSECVASAAVEAADIMNPHVVWEEHGQRDLNFGGEGHCEEEDECFRRRTSRDPMSHRIIEKRRRDRMNSCLADLSRLIPAEYLKRGRGRIEKTEIIEMAIRHMRHLQESQSFLSGHPTPPPSSSLSSSSSSSSSSSPGSLSSSYSGAAASVNCHQVSSVESCETADDGFERFATDVRVNEQYRSGFLECLTETLHFLIEVEGFPANGSLCLSLDSHLRGHCTALLKGEKTPKADCGQDGHSQYIASSAKGNGEHGGCEHTASEEEPDIAQHGENRDYEEMEHIDANSMLKQKDGHCHSNSLSQLSTVSCQKTGASYKFKNNIKRRFTAGLEKRNKVEGESVEKKCYKDSSVLLMRSIQSPISSQTTYLQTDSKSSRAFHSQQQHTPSSQVPVFALHSEHSFYVPLMLDLDTLAPHASLLSKQAPALHPVTISVNFCNGGEDECDDDKSALMAPSQSIHPLQSEIVHRNWKTS